MNPDLSILDNSSPFTGWIDELRISKGVARYMNKQEILKKASTGKHRKPVWGKGNWTIDFSVRAGRSSIVKLSNLIKIPEYTSLIDQVPQVKLTDGEWHHIAVTCSYRKTHIYMDGKRYYRTKLEEALDNL